MDQFNFLFADTDAAADLLHAALRVKPEAGHETQIEWDFNSPNPDETVVIRLSAMRCSFRMPGAQRSTETVDIQDESGWVIVDNVGDDPVVLITTTWFGAHTDTTPQELVIDETRPGTYKLHTSGAATGSSPAFRDLSGTVTVTTLETKAHYEAGYGDEPVGRHRREVTARQ